MYEIYFNKTKDKPDQNFILNTVIKKWRESIRFQNCAAAQHMNPTLDLPNLMRHTKRETKTWSVIKR